MFFLFYFIIFSILLLENEWFLKSKKNKVSFKKEFNNSNLINL